MSVERSILVGEEVPFPEEVTKTSGGDDDHDDKINNGAATGALEQSLAMPLVDLPEYALLQIMGFCGPKYSRTGLGSTCHYLRQLSASNVLWAQFWNDRCLYCLPTNSTPPPPPSSPLSFASATTTITITRRTSAHTSLHAGVAMWRSAKRPPIIIQEENDNTIFQAYVEQHGQHLPNPTEEVIVRDLDGEIVVRERREIRPLGCSLDFERCSFCSIRACRVHFLNERWRICDVCEVASCPSCEGSLLVGPIGRCQPTEYSRDCKKKICVSCAAWVTKTGSMVTTVPATKDDVAKAGGSLENGCLMCLQHAKRCYDVCNKVERGRIQQLKELNILPNCCIHRATATQQQHGCSTRNQIKKQAALQEKHGAYSWSFGSYDTLDTKGRRGRLCLGLSPLGHVSGMLQMARYKNKIDLSTPNKRDVDYDVIGLGPAWNKHDPTDESCLPRMVDGRSDCVVLKGLVAPGPNYQFRSNTQLGFVASLRIERISAPNGVLTQDASQEHTWLKCRLEVEDRRVRCMVHFAAAPKVRGEEEPVVVPVHSAAEVKADVAVFKPVIWYENKHEEPANKRSKLV